MASLVQKYTEDLPQVPPKKNHLIGKSGLSVVLTGSTGSLGIHLLRLLLDDSTIMKIYCLNRSANGREREDESFANLGLERNLNLPRVEFIQAHYGESQWGLPDAQFKELSSTVDIIIHNA